MKAIQIKHLSCTDTKGSRLKAWTDAGSIIVARNHLDPDVQARDLDEGLNLGDELNAALNAIIGLGLDIEICGSWIWVSGDTRPHREVLKAAGFKWAPKKLMWSYSPAGKKTWSRGGWDMEQIRANHGSVTVKSKQHQRLSA
jgi:hypothetical protein